MLSGGGARGAYEVGVVAGIIEALQLKPQDRAPFSIFSGTSVGAFNAAFLVGAAHRGDLDIETLTAMWRRLRIRKHMPFSPRNFWRAPADRAPSDGRERASQEYGPRLLDPLPLSLLLREAVDWGQIHRNIDQSRVHAFIVAALDVADGVTTVFTETAPNVRYTPSPDPRRRNHPGRIGPDEVLASAALPFVFPGRKVGGRHLVDGGLRFNTPISPALRAGADRLVVVNLATERPPATASPVDDDHYPNALFLAGKMLNALLLDQVSYDIQVLGRFNRLLEVLDDALPPEARAKVDEVTRRTRGAAYRRVESLVVRPSADIGRIAGEHVRRLRKEGAFPWPLRVLFDRVDSGEPDWEADWASFLLFDGGFAEALVALGRRDLLARRDEVVSFLAV